MQMLIFFLLGLLATPSAIIPVLVPAISIALFLTFAARPLFVFSILTPAKCVRSQQLLVSFAGLRGAASIVFAIMATVNGVYIQYDVFHIAFCIALFSILIQGTLLPAAAKRLDMLDADMDVLKTFNDYSDESDLQFIKLVVRDKIPIVPNGETIILLGDMSY